MLPCSCFHSNPHSAAVQSLYLQFPAPTSLHFLILKPLPSFFFVICFLSHPLHLTVALPSLFLYGYIHIYISPPLPVLLPFQYSFLLSSLSVRAEGKDCAMQETGSQIHPFSSCSNKMSVHFFERKQRKLCLPLACIRRQQQQQQQQQCGTVCRLQSGGQTERWIDRERESVLCARLTAGCAPQMLHHA